MANKVKIHLRKQYNLFTNNFADWTYVDKYYKSSNVGLLVIGLWDSHNCKVANKILNEISPKANEFIKRCRSNGSRIIFGSSSLTKNPKYKHLANNMKVPFQKFKDYGLNIPPLPFDDSDGGIVEKNNDFNRKDVSMHPSIEIADNDCMSGNSKEIMNYLVYHNIELVLVVGVHLNMCVLDRPYAIKNLMRYGVKVALVKDLTDIMYSQKTANTTERKDSELTSDAPGTLSRDEMMKRMIDWIEINVCPTTKTNEVIYLNDRQVYYIDVDNTICHGKTYEDSKPDMEMIEKVNEMYDSGKYVIIYWTARGSVGGNDWKSFTEKQLKRWGVKCHGVQVNKCWFDKFVDDKNMTIEQFKNQ